MGIAKPDVRAIFDEALQRSPEGLNEYLDSACNGDTDVRSQVDALLISHREAGEFLGGEPSDIPTTTELATERLGGLVGPYKLLQKLGEGGFGVVYMAEQKKPVERRVALKIIKPGMDTGQVIARFEAERQVLAMMDHPCIAKIFDAGATSSGHPFFVMELVKGIPITQYCDEQNLSPGKRLELFVRVCQAVQHAHQKGIIHRDLKPQNVLVAEYDKQPVPKVIDFGIAKATNQSLTEKTIFTQLGQFIGTPEYMSPEQAQVSQLDIDTRSDIYSLGVILYELLTGVTPLERERLRSAGYEEILRMIREEDPPKPSTRVSTLGASTTTLAKARRITVDKLRRMIRGDLDWIVMKALEKDRGRRYETADAFAVDIQRYLSEETVLARPPSSLYRFQKFARRNKTSLSVAGALAICLILLGGTAWVFGQRIRAQQLIVTEFGSFMMSKPEKLLERAKQLQAMPATERVLRDIMDRQAEDASLLHARLVLVGMDDRYAQPLLDSLLDGDDSLLEDREARYTPYLPVIRDVLMPFSDSFEEQLWSIFNDEDAESERRFRAGVTLASFAPESTHWDSADSDIRFLADNLVEKSVDYQTDWREFTRPLAAATGPQSAFLRGLEERFGADDAEVRLNSVKALIAFARHDHGRMARLLSKAAPEQFRVLFEAIEESRHPDLLAALEAIVVSSPTPELSPAQRVELGAERAGAAIALLRLGKYRSVVPVFEHTDDPEAMTQFIHRCQDLDVRPTHLLQCLKFSEGGNLSGEQVRYALTLALGEFPPEDVLAGDTNLVKTMERRYQENPSSGVHGASGWLLRHLHRDSVVSGVDRTEVPYTPDREWFTRRVSTPEGEFFFTFVVFPAGEYTIGSPEDEPRREAKKELQHKVTISRPFALLDREITFAEVKAFNPALVDRMEKYQAAGESQSELAAPGPHWNDAVDFCRWLSEQASVSEDSQAYPQDDRTLRLDRSGYRLPTEAEWEVACRTGLRTRHFHGGDENLLQHYGWFGENSEKRLNVPKRKRPNQRGLFDMHGNLFEWCHDWMWPYPKDASPADYAGPARGMKRVLRGGCWGVSPDLCRAANRMAHSPHDDFIFMGIRLAVTLPSAADPSE